MQNYILYTYEEADGQEVCHAYGPASQEQCQSRGEAWKREVESRGFMVLPLEGLPA